MSAPSQFYCGSEDDAQRYIRRHFTVPQSSKATHSAATASIDWPVTSLFSRGSLGKALNQPLFERPTRQTAVQLPTVPKFRLTYEIQDLNDNNDEKTQCNRKWTEEEDDDTPDADPHYALADMRYQFDHWTRENREGIDAIPFAVAKAPEYTHAALAQDVMSHGWTSSQHTEPNQSNDQQQQRGALVQHLWPAAEAQLTQPQSTLNESETNKQAPHDENEKPHETVMSKHAAMIAKKKASADSILATKSTMQKRSAVQKKNRKPIKETPETSGSRQAKTKDDTNKETTVLLYEDNPEGYQTAINQARNLNLIKADDPQAAQNLLQRMLANAAKKSKNKEGQSAGD